MPEISEDAERVELLEIVSRFKNWTQKFYPKNS